MKRRGPSEGYDFGNKRQYRRSVWKLFRLGCVGDLAESQALLMPSAEGDEIEVALNNGFREYNLHVVDQNPAIVAHLKRRYPRITTYGVSVAEAARRIRRNGVRLSVANLDLCNTASQRLHDELAAFSGHEPMLDGGLIAVTVLRGRERGDSWRLIEKLGSIPRLDNDFGRQACVQSALMDKWGGLAAGNPDAMCWFPIRVDEGSYRSTAGNQTMLWGIWQMRQKEFTWLKRFCDEDTTPPLCQVGGDR